MCLITCNLNCAHQQDGYCTLNSVAAVTCTEKNTCPHFVKKEMNTSAIPKKPQMLHGYSELRL